MTDEVVTRAEQVYDHPRVFLEVDAIDVRARREPRPLDERELETLCERALTAPGRRGAGHASVHEDEALHEGILRRATSLRGFPVFKEFLLLQAGWYAPAGMTPHSLATASGLLLGSLALAMGVGALLGAAFGSWDIGLLIGALVGIPLGVGVVYWVYTRSEGGAT